jgi:hypothetical protein
MREVCNQEWDDIQDRLKERDAQIDKLLADNADLKMAISSDELLPLTLINARLIEENEELRKLLRALPNIAT